MRMILIDFYSNKRTDNYNRFLSDILKFDNSELENTHNYIQWLFPNHQKSQFYPKAPTLNVDIINSFINNKICNENLNKSFNLMLKFYGFEKKNEQIILAKNFESRKPYWLKGGNHNYLRLTRIIKSIYSLGLKSDALNLQKLLLEIYLIYPNKIGEKTYRFWKTAI